MSLDTIIVAAISLLGTLAGSYFANSKTMPCCPTAWSSWSARWRSTTPSSSGHSSWRTTCRPRSARLTRFGKRCTSIRGRKESRDGGGGRNPLRLSRLFFCESHQFIRGKRLLEQTAHRRSWSKLPHRRAATQKRNWLPRSRVDCPGCI